MPRRQERITPGHFYHVYNRGNNRRSLFNHDADYIHFLRSMRKYLVPTIATINAYVLMPNHFHMLVLVNSDDFSHAMQLLGISYSKSINRKYHYVGSLFQGAFQAKGLSTDPYLLQVAHYIHLNPVRAGMVKIAEDWLYSSAGEYLGSRNGTLPNPEFIFSLLWDVEREHTPEWWNESRKKYRLSLNECGKT